MSMLPINNREEHNKVDLNEMNCPSFVVTKIVAIKDRVIKAIVFVLYWIAVVLTAGTLYGIDLLANKKNYEEKKALEGARTPFSGARTPEKSTSLVREQEATTEISLESKQIAENL